MNTHNLSQTISSSPIDLGPILDRVKITAQLLSALSVEPDGPALIFEVPGTQEVRALPLLSDDIVVGRAALSPENPEGCHLAFPESSKLSSRHFRIRHQGGEFVLEDLGSKNGTYVNTNEHRTQTKTLVAADIIYAGGIKFAFTGE